MTDPEQAEREFLEASIAVWEEIDRLTDESGTYPGLPQSTELRQRERAAWERYRDSRGGKWPCPTCHSRIGGCPKCRRAA